MSQQNNEFGHTDGVDLKDLFEAQIKNVLTLIDANDKNYNQRFENVIQATQSALASADRAVNKAESATEKRFEGVNEFRSALSDQSRNFLTRTEFDAKWEGMERNRKDNTSLIIAVLGMVISLVSLVSRFI